jgi:type IV secretory pathway ATPase VirB11/archaellum biosynthesis ATPase
LTAVLWSTVSLAVLGMLADPKVEELCAGAKALPVPPEHRPDPKRQRYPTLASDQVQSWLTGVRTRMLKDFGD